MAAGEQRLVRARPGVGQWEVREGVDQGCDLELEPMGLAES